MLVWHRTALAHRPRRGALLPPRLGSAIRRAALNPFPLIRDHVLLPRASRIAEVDAGLAARLTPAGARGHRRPRSGRLARGRRRASATRPSRRAPPTCDHFVRRLAGAARVRHGGRPCPRMHTYDYAIVRVVPRVERGEFVNVGVIVSCDAHRLPRGADRARRGPRPGARSRPPTSSAIRAAPRRRSPPSAPAAPAPARSARLSPRERFHWLVAPRSTIIQTSPVHTGRTQEPKAVIDHLFETMVGGPRRAASPATQASARSAAPGCPPGEAPDGSPPGTARWPAAARRRRGARHWPPPPLAAMPR